MKIAATGTTITIEFVGSEPELLRLLAIQLDELIEESEPEDADVLLALFPDAYREDAESAAEFGRLTRDELNDTKRMRAREISAALLDSDVVILDAAQADRWASALTDIRLVVGTRLGIETDDDQPGIGLLDDIYRWLGEFQWQLVDALAELEPDPEATP